MAASSTAPSIITESMQRLLQVRDLWTRSQKDQLEIGRLLYEERNERLSVGGSHTREGFHEWLREAGVPKTSAYRRIAEYEISIGVRDESDKYENPVPHGTTMARLLFANGTLEGFDALVRASAEGTGQEKVAELRDAAIGLLTEGRVGRTTEPVIMSESEARAHVDALLPKTIETETAAPAVVTLATIAQSLQAVAPKRLSGNALLWYKADKAMDRAADEAERDADPALAAMLAPLTPEELESDQKFESTLEASAMDILPPEESESDLAQLRQLLKGTGLELKKSDHGSKYRLDKLTAAQVREIATLLVSE